MRPFHSSQAAALLAAALGLAGILRAQDNTETDLKIVAEGTTRLVFAADATRQALWPYLTVARKDTGAALKFTAEKHGQVALIAGNATLTFGFRFDAIPDCLLEAVYAVPFSLQDGQAATESKCLYAARQVRSLDGRQTQLAGYLGGLLPGQESKAGEAFGGLPAFSFDNSPLMYSDAPALQGAGAGAGAPARPAAVYRLAPGGTPIRDTELKAGPRKSPQKADDNQVAGFDLAGLLGAVPETAGESL
jgi:hypothetical protein